MSSITDAEDQVIKRAASDPIFRKRLLADPTATLIGAGVDIPAGVSIRVVEDAATVTHLVLPMIDTDRVVSDSELESIAGGRCLATEQKANF